MRVAFLVGHFPRLSETFVLNQITGLLDRGHDVDIYTEHIEGWTKVHPDVEKYRLWERTFLIHSVPQNYIWRVLRGLWLTLIHFRQAPWLILRSLNVFAYGTQAASLWLLYSAISLAEKQASYDIIHCQFGTQGYRGATFKRLLKPMPKLLVMFRGHDISRYVKEGGDKVYQALFKDVDYCLANCDFFRQRVIDLGWNAEKISVHFSGIDIKKFKFKPRSLSPGESIKIATVGRLEEKKGIEYAIRAVAKQIEKTPSLAYYIIGDGSLKASLHALICSLGMDSNIHLLGWKNEAEIIQVLDDCHVFIAPSVTASDGNQDAPINVLKEAMAMGLPVISTCHGGIPELVEDGVSGYLVPERDVYALAEKLEYMLAHPERWPDMGEAGRKFVERHFDLQNLNDLLVVRYKQILSQDHWKNEKKLLSQKGTASFSKKSPLRSAYFEK
ncbi:glycosyltransferase [Nodosilinea sp. AN01ver1]|uniref:glycosyltransferase n=1 Tax=Nodosilinea sp. AN01ver1 TaxID=3423362 RepID=UPI003D321BB5